MEPFYLPVAERTALLKRAGIKFFEKNYISANLKGEIIRTFLYYNCFNVTDEQKIILKTAYPFVEFKEGIGNYPPFRKSILICFPTPFQVERMK